MAHENDWVKRGIYEAAFIKTLEPSINIDPGRHQLSSHFDSILKSVISAPLAPPPHNPETENLINTAPRRTGRPRRDQNNDIAIAAQSQPPPENRESANLRPQPQRQSQRICKWMNKVPPDFIPFWAAALLPLTPIHYHAKQGNGYR